MTAVWTALLSIWALAAAGWVARRFFGVPACPICVGVAGTWLWMLAARHYGVPVDTAMLPLLLGGSVVGIAYQLEHRLPPGRSPMLWKSVVVPLGFGAAFALEQQHAMLFAASVLALAASAVAFFRRSGPAPAPDGERLAELKRQMKQCC
jgi:hypothetical protein